MILYKEGLALHKIVPRIGAPDTMDDEGRLIVLESDDFYFVNVYTPNAGDGLKRLSERSEEARYRMWRLQCGAHGDRPGAPREQSHVCRVYG